MGYLGGNYYQPPPNPNPNPTPQPQLNTLPTFNSTGGSLGNTPYLGIVRSFDQLPSQSEQNSFLPGILRDPYVSGMNAAAQVGSWAGAALPGASSFQSSLYSPGLNQMEQAFMQSGANQGLRGLADSFNRIDAQYEGTPFHSSRGTQMDDAALQFSDQMTGRAAGLGLQRQQLAASNLPVAFGTPLQAATSQQEMASGLYNLAQQGMTGELQFPLSMYSGYPMVSPAVVQSSGGRGGKK